MMVFPMAAIKRAIPWWSLPLNWLVDSAILAADPYPAWIQAFALTKAVKPEWHQIFLRGIGFVANMFFVPLGILFHADLTVAAYIRKSFIAAFLGNTVGALFVALPAVYFYLGDRGAGGLEGVEEGEGLNGTQRDSVMSDPADSKRES
ncbi:hypothetical protein HWV62_19763 [Athelia sp. TMB]|nr:hypothetical protein HWV62_19763 [Athelia sp. TMB]